MYPRAIIVTLFCVGLKLVNCGTDVEEVTFLNYAVDEYSPVFVKDLLMDHINHRMEQIQVISKSSIGINSKQVDLCNSVHEGFAILLSDLELMEESRVIKGDDNYEKTMKGFISEFASLTETFNREFEFLKLPDLTKDTPDALLEIKVTDAISIKNFGSKLFASLEIYRGDIKKYESTGRNETTWALAQSTVHNLDDIGNRAIAIINNYDFKYEYRINAIIHDILVDFKQIVDMFYRQLAFL